MMTFGESGPHDCGWAAVVISITPRGPDSKDKSSTKDNDEMTKKTLNMSTSSLN